MANTNNPFGFRPYTGTGVTPSWEQVEGQTAYNASAIYFGDPVVFSSGKIIRASTSGATGNTELAGVFVGCKYLSVSQGKTVWMSYWPGSDVASGNTVTSYFINDPNMQFVVQADSTGFTQANVGSVFGFNIGTGSATGVSGAYLTTTAVTDGSAPFRLAKLITDPPGSAGTASGAYNWVVVGFNFVTTKALT